MSKLYALEADNIERIEELEAELAALRDDKARLEKALSDFREYHDQTLDEWSERC